MKNHSESCQDPYAIQYFLFNSENLPKYIKETNQKLEMNCVTPFEYKSGRMYGKPAAARYSEKQNILQNKIAPKKYKWLLNVTEIIRG